jgi:hypothetical protein
MIAQRAPFSSGSPERAKRLFFMSMPEIPVREGAFTPRQCARRKVALPFRLGGLDAFGQFFEEMIVTRDFSDCGGSFAASHSIKVGSTLKLGDSTGFLSLIRVAWGQPSGETTHNYGFFFIQPLEEQLDAAS